MMAGDEVYGDEVTSGLPGDDGVHDLAEPVRWPILPSAKYVPFVERGEGQ